MRAAARPGRQGAGLGQAGCRARADKVSRGEGSKQFLIKWKGYPEDRNTWEPPSILQHCSQAVTEYELSKGGLYMDDLFTRAVSSLGEAFG